VDQDNHFYYLFGVMMHTGSFEIGHYYALVKDDNGEWWKLDDLKSQQIPITDVDNDLNDYNNLRPLLLFWAREHNSLHSYPPNRIQIPPVIIEDSEIEKSLNDRISQIDLLLKKKRDLLTRMCNELNNMS